MTKSNKVHMQHVLIPVNRTKLIPTMANSGEAYMTIVTPEHNIPRTVSWMVP